MKAIDNLIRLFKINNQPEYAESDIFHKFIEEKKAEHELEEMTQELEKYSSNELLELVEANNILCQNSYYSYFKQSFTTNNPLVLGEHIELICDVLTLAERGLFKDKDTKTRIAISVPPRHLKSTSITNCFPSWFMGKEDWRNCIVTSYGDNLVQKAGQKNREKIFELAGPLFGVKVRTDVSQKSMWELKGGGRFKGATIRGGATGEGAELLIIDDPVKNREEANSKTIQERNWDEYNDTYLTRVHNNGIIILIMTRWHNSDLRGKIEESEKHLKWLKLDLMAICETEEETALDPLGREIGQALYPQKYDEKYFVPFKANPRTWWSLYKQKPQVDSGEYFQRNYFRYFEWDNNFVYLYDETGIKKFLHDSCYVFQTIDTAQKDGKANDETVILTVIVTPEKDLLIVDCYHGRIKVPEQEKMIDKYWNKWTCSFQAIEDKQSGTGIIQKLVSQGRPIETLKAVGDKIERATTAILYYANSKIYHLKNAEWLGSLENQLLEFPNAKHDDIVDCVSYAALVVADRSKKSSIGGE